MCMTCGCGTGDVHVEDAGHAHTHTHTDGSTHSPAHDHAQGAYEHVHEAAHGHSHTHADGSVHRHDPAQAHAHEHGHRSAEGQMHTHADGTTHAHAHHDPAHTHGADALHYGAGTAGNSAPGMTQSRLVQIERDILSKNDAIAMRNRAALAQRGIFALNLVSSPGSGKTTLLVRSIERLAGRLPVAVIEGDQQTSVDAERIRATGAAAIQINTGKGCHLDAAMIETALQRLAPTEDSVLMIENVGNLVCPAAFDLGEAHKVVVLSVTEGEDKPLKYPDMFHAASLMLLNKVDLLPHLSFDVERCLEYARRINPSIQILQVSATSGAGMDAWLGWIESGAHAARRQRPDPVAALPHLEQVATLKRRVAELEAQVTRLQSS